MKKKLNQLIILCCVAAVSFTACKKSSNNPSGGSYSMKVTLNGTASTYNTCIAIDESASGIAHEFSISASNPNGKDTFAIGIIADLSTVKAGQSFRGDTAFTDNNTADIAYYSPAGLAFSTQPGDPSALVTLTAVSSAAIGGTFSCKLYDAADFLADTLKYTVTGGTFNAQISK